MDSLTITEYAHNRKMISLTGLLVREFNSAFYFTNIERKEKVLHNRNCHCLLTGQNSGNSFEASLRQKEAQAGARGKAGYPRARHPDRPAHAAGRRAQQDHGGRGCAS